MTGATELNWNKNLAAYLQRRLGNIVSGQPLSLWKLSWSRYCSVIKRTKKKVDSGGEYLILKYLNLLIPHFPNDFNACVIIAFSLPLKLAVTIEVSQSVSQFSCSVVSDSLWHHESQHARLPCPWPIPRVYPNSCPLSQWCHPAISSSVVPFSSCPQPLPASGSFPMSQLFAWGGQIRGNLLQLSCLIGKKDLA